MSPLHFHGRTNLPSRNAEVPWDDHPLLDPLRIAHSFFVSSINANLDSLHHFRVRSLEHVLDCVSAASNRSEDKIFYR